MFLHSFVNLSRGVGEVFSSRLNCILSIKLVLGHGHINIIAAVVKAVVADHDFFEGMLHSIHSSSPFASTLHRSSLHHLHLAWGQPSLVQPRTVDIEMTVSRYYFSTNSVVVCTILTNSYPTFHERFNSPTVRASKSNFPPFRHQIIATYSIVTLPQAKQARPQNDE